MTTAAKRTNTKQQIDAQEAVDSLKRLSSKSVKDSMPRYGIPTDNALGVPVGKIQQLAKKIGPNHELAEALWLTAVYEARMLASMIDEPSAVTLAQMDRWCRDFDSWAIADTVCFKLFDQTPHAWKKVHQWAKRRGEFEKRAAFALLASLGVHDKSAKNEQFLACLPLIEEAATDERNYVKKGVSWALRVIGRRNTELNEASVALATRLAASTNSASRWIGKDALREFAGPVVQRRLKKQLKAKGEKS